jgi:hypothetical protein
MPRGRSLDRFDRGDGAGGVSTTHMASSPDVIVTQAGTRHAVGSADAPWTMLVATFKPR